MLCKWIIVIFQCFLIKKYLCIFEYCKYELKLNSGVALINNSSKHLTFGAFVHKCWYILLCTTSPPSSVPEMTISQLFLSIRFSEMYVAKYCYIFISRKHNIRNSMIFFCECVIWFDYLLERLALILRNANHKRNEFRGWVLRGKRLWE